MGFFRSKTPEEKFKEKIARKYYSDALALVYGKGLDRAFVSAVVLKEYQRAESEGEEGNVRTLRRLFEAYLKSPEERFQEKIAKGYYHELLELAVFEKLDTPFVDAQLSQARERLLKQGDTADALKVEGILEEFLRMREKEGQSAS